MSTLIKDQGVWKGPEIIYVKDNGLWKEIKEQWVYDAGLWKKVYSSFSLPNVGDFWEGGYYAGLVQQTDGVYAIIVAPKTLGGEYSGFIRWQTTTNVVSGAFSTNDGLANTEAMENSSRTNPAGEFCWDLIIEGYDDWYLPAKDEIEVMYRNLKPTTQNNNANFGQNPNSVPPKGNYLTNSPTQTEAELFKEGGAEAFQTSGAYWSSTQYSASSAYVKVFTTGQELTTTKTNTSRVRAIRRVLIPDANVPV